jgi:hypothetical protein
MQILGEASYEVLVNRCSPISKPLANEKLTKSLLKITKKGNFFVPFLMIVVVVEFV